LASGASMSNYAFSLFRRTRPLVQSQRGAARNSRAFSLIEILIVVCILAIIALCVVPQFTSASQQARENTIKDELRYLRTQIVVFKAQHQDIPPGYTNGDPTQAPSGEAFSQQMTMSTNINCVTSATPSSVYSYGPYLSQMPTNPINGDSTMTVVPNNASMPAPDGTTGWIYQPQTQTIMVNLTGKDSSGVPFSSY
jgi:prepilin-type N-terminal cleavage/methylation domain-containing protein